MAQNCTATVAEKKIITGTFYVQLETFLEPFLPKKVSGSYKRKTLFRFLQVNEILTTSTSLPSTFSHSTDLKKDYLKNRVVLLVAVQIMITNYVMRNNNL